MPTASSDEKIAFAAAKMLANGMGGLDWSGLPFVCAYLGIEDISSLIHRLTIIKTYRKPEGIHGTGDT